jgi:hypothetical protein
LADGAQAERKKSEGTRVLEECEALRATTSATRSAERVRRHELAEPEWRLCGMRVIASGVTEHYSSCASEASARGLGRELERSE